MKSIIGIKVTSVIKLLNMIKETTFIDYPKMNNVKKDFMHVINVSVLKEMIYLVAQLLTL